MESNGLRIPRIDLENFEDSQFKYSKYVLTSPRSLEACSLLGIPPVDLLHKSRTEFLQHFKKLPPSKIEELYIKSEEQRRDKLVKAKLQRQKLLAHTAEYNHENDIFQPAEICPVNDEYWVPHIRRNSVSHLSSKKNHNFSNFEPIILKKDSHLTENLQPSASRPQSAVCRKSQYGKSSNGVLQNHGQRLMRRASYSSFDKERQFWTRKQSQEKLQNDQRERAIKRYKEKLNKVEKHRNQILKEKERNLIAAHHERARKVSQVLERRKQLKKMIDEYRKELYEAREQSVQRAIERVSSRLSEEQKRLASERRQKQMQVEENVKEMQRREQELRKAAELALQQKDEHIRRLIEEKEARIQQSRNLALAAECLREEMLRVYNLDSFDKKVQKVTLINEMGLNGN
ncbi:hypothetical protein MN116_005890 [Schistosoma mekongi]|uniref:Coiled-coil domain-containing protein 177 n=1 Tax=Schistosoma mekongi TaxID=38744 RepID=A0AAE1ZAR4_SCHME|nr:hypothetical protein MN116_005890 [Schistosoma mekongi]